MYIANIRVTFKTAPHEEISHMILLDSNKRKLYEALLAQNNISEVIIIQTCNRFEIYIAGTGESEGIAQARKILLNWFGAYTAKYMKIDTYLDAVNHLFRMVSSLDSMVIGESQILAQVKDSLNYSMRHNYSRKILKLAFQKALSVGKKVRTSTNISNGKVSISSVAVDHANLYSPIKDKKIIIVGTGKMAALVAEYLPLFNHRELVVIGRTPVKLKKFCDIFSGHPRTFDQLQQELNDTDIVFSATTCPNVLITKEMIEKTINNRTKPLTIIDIAMPEDVDPTVGNISNVNYFCIDDLREISKKNSKSRRGEAEKAETIIQDEISRFKNKLQSIHIDRLLSDLNNYTEEIRQREVNKSIRMLGKTEKKAKTVVDGLSKSIMKKTMHNFIIALKSSQTSAEEIERLINLFTNNNHNNVKKPNMEVKHGKDVSKRSIETIKK